MIKFIFYTVYFGIWGVGIEGETQDRETSRRQVVVVSQVFGSDGLIEVMRAETKGGSQTKEIGGGIPGPCQK